MTSEVESTLRRSWVPAEGELSAMVDNSPSVPAARVDLVVPAASVQEESRGL